MTSHPTELYQDFCDNTKTTFYLNISALLLILVFLVSPLRLSKANNMLVKLFIVSILGYSLYLTVFSSYSLVNIDNFFYDASLGNVRTNIGLNLILGMTMLYFIFYLLYSLFY